MEESGLRGKGREILSSRLAFFFILVVVVLGNVVLYEIYTIYLPHSVLRPTNGKGKVLHNKRIRHLPKQERRSFKMKHVLPKNVLSVELWAQIAMNRIKSYEIGKKIHQESYFREVHGDPGPKYNYCTPLPDCPRAPQNIKGHITPERIKQLADESPTAEGEWSPQNCTSRHSIAIVIPYRDRKEQLTSLLRYLPTILKKHQINYRIFVVEQVGNDSFNKGVLMNAGFLTALSRPSHGVIYHCFIFHDVDLLSEDDRNMYTCPERPRHLSVAVNRLSYKLPYRELAGGVFAVQTEHFMRLNGYSNLYWGWGGEDDDMGNRPPEWIARYQMVKHKRGRPIPWRVRSKLIKSWLRYEMDGLNTVSYRLISVTQERNYTHVMVDVGKPPPYYLNQVKNFNWTLPRKKRIAKAFKLLKHATAI